MDSIRALSMCAAILFLTLFLFAGTTRAQVQEHVLYSFCDNSPSCPDGAFPYAGLAADNSGNVYGTTYDGGGGMGCNGVGCGEVFRLTLTKEGFKQTVLHGFAASATDGLFPEASVIVDHEGNLYGTTSAGGNLVEECPTHSCGIAFELSPGANDEWTETILYAFCAETNCNDGATPGPGASLIFDAAGNLYGATTSGGVSTGHCAPGGCGTVYELVRGKNGWSEKILYRFIYAQGAFPEANLTFDKAGNLYGTTNGGGTNGLGTVFELTPGSNGEWTETVLHSFNTADGRDPQAGVIFDAAGNLYGTTFLGGTGAGCVYTYGCGTVFELSPGSNGKWNEQVLYSFCSQTNCTDGASPFGGLIAGAKGVMYGTTYEGGSGGTTGVVYKVTFSKTWSESLVYDLGSVENNGATNPEGALVLAKGYLVGTGEYGGYSTFCNNDSTCGAIFAVDPNAK